MALGTAIAIVRLHGMEFDPQGQPGRQSSRFYAEIERCRFELPRSLLARYERLKERYARGAVAEVENGMCSGCRVMLPRMVAKRLKEDIAFCDHCGRILYDPDHVYNFQY